jgi:AraC family L-rhamnose operon regulatory protein RhaS
MEGFGLTDHRGPFKRKRLAQHTNPGLEVVYVASGRPVWATEGRAEVVHPGWLFYSLPWEVHGSVAEYEEGWEIYFTNILLDADYSRPRRTFGFHPVFAIPVPDARRLSRALTGTRRRAHPATAAMGWLLPALVRDVTRPGFARRTAATSLAGSVLVELARSVIQERPRGEHLAAARSRVRDFFRELPRRCGEPWTLERMAAACRLGRTRFAELVKRETGETPIAALNRVRVAEARRMLIETDLSITDVALDSGFSSSQYFARVFRLYTETSAREFRRSRRTRRRGKS